MNESYLVLAFNTVHDWAVCFQRVLYCGHDKDAAVAAVLEVRDYFDFIETQTWEGGNQVKRFLHEKVKEGFDKGDD